MTDPLEGVTDAHLQAALDEGGHGCDVAYVRNYPDINEAVIALARQIAATEKIAAERDIAKAELAKLRAKYEPEPVDPVKAEALSFSLKWGVQEGLAEACIRRGMEMQKAEAPEIELDWGKLSAAMQPAPFTREEAERIANYIYYGNTNIGSVECMTMALTTPHAELLAMLGDG